MVSRRKLVAAGAAGGVSLLLPPSVRRGHADGATPPVRPAQIPKYVTPLTIPAAMPMSSTVPAGPFDEYVISVRQFRQQVLPPGLPATTVWGYGSPDHPETFGYPARTLEARVDRPVRVTWANELLDERGNFLPHLLAVDPTRDWANPGGGETGRDSPAPAGTTSGPYTGPVPFVTHLHGAHVGEESDGYPEAWYLPDAGNIPDGFARYGSAYDGFRRSFDERHLLPWRPGTATYQYPNDQRASTLWYHDHTMGMTRLNVYAGPAGFYLLRGGPTDLPAGVLPGPAPAVDEPAGVRSHEIPLVIQDRSFTVDGALSYPDSGRLDGHAGPGVPEHAAASAADHMVFGDTIVVNGRTWPVLEVEPRRYRLRLLNGCNSRFLVLGVTANPTVRPASSVLPFWQVGGDGGFLPGPVPQQRLVLGVAERMDVVVDFTEVPEGTALYLVNEGPDHPYAGGEPGVDFEVADPQTTGQVLKFVVGALTGPDTSLPPEQLRLPAIAPLGTASRTRRLALSVSRGEGPGPAAVQVLGTMGPDGAPLPHGFHSPVTENPVLGATEIWEFHNYTPDAHSMHIHQVQFQVLGRGRNGRRPPEDSERGYKDTVVALPGDVTRVKARFDTAGRFTWHCHILEHEDGAMMLPFQVGPLPADPHPGALTDGGGHGSGT
ncbi:multicopper oxidase domain-containing protein [Plantactinospora sp. S1510]|uniref:Multicopper oxidase CueO n=1 Tax=Plantactinospora alkalitolerans TaxID=2789879 RepID=A0ABS0H3U9_9ACTN|nr:multicopper oxidase domain-containing protein [Plantactinospora alkalitolerans]MBF9132976.1 multicopper oxidase domain-containing protein [Plantactinospora alkalitolerans]